MLDPPRRELCRRGEFRLTRPARRTMLESMTRRREMPLPLRGRGGAGRGQGRKKVRHDYVPHVRRPFLERRHPVHVSTRLRDGLPSLRGRHLWKAVRQAFVGGCARPRFRIVHFSVQGQHLHLLCEAPDRAALARGVQGFKVRVARGVNRACGRRGTVFRDRYHARTLRTPTECRHALAYVLNNQRHHAYAEHASYPRATVDPLSSAMFFDGWTVAPRPWAAEPPAPPGGGPLVAAPRTWLLQVGWRRGGGPISPDHVPGLPRNAPALPVW
jgi:REP element-mobilizing transposase RayT